MIADRLSRPNQPITTEWGLHLEIVNRIFGTWGTLTVEMFATVHNTHLPQFMSPIPEPRALAIDTLLQDWQGRSMNMFSPFPTAQQSHSETMDHPGGRSDSNISPLVAVRTVVSTSTTSVCGPLSHHSVPPAPTVTTGVHVCLGWQVIPSAAWFFKRVSRRAAAPRRLD